MAKLTLLVKKPLGKAVFGLLGLPAPARWFRRVIRLYDKTLIRKERAAFETPCAPRLDFSYYLPDTPARIEHLRRIVGGRPVAIILHGPSAAELERRIGELKDRDICYFGLNAFRTPETGILGQIGRRYSVVMYSAIERGVDSQIGNVVDFLERPDDNLFVSERRSFGVLESEPDFNLGEFIRRHDRKLLFVATVPTMTMTLGGAISLRSPNLDYPLHFLAQSSFSILLALAVIGKAPLVTVFGGDGGRIAGRELYYKDAASQLSEQVLESSLAFDTRVFNMTMPVMLEKVRRMYGVGPVDIVNCSLHSNYVPMRKLSYDDTFALLKSGRDRN